MLLDLKEIETLSQKREKENLRFRRYLKEQDEEYIDDLVHKLNKEISAQIDCTQCGNCCTMLKPILSESDIDIMLKRLNLTRADFKIRFVETDSDGDMLLKHLPCKFLKDRKCTIYTSRPEDCQSYPHLHKDRFTSRLFGVLENYGICPIVFNVVEALKMRLNFY